MPVADPASLDLPYVLDCEDEVIQWSRRRAFERDVILTDERLESVVTRLVLHCAPLVFGEHRHREPATVAGSCACSATSQVAGPPSRALPRRSGDVMSTFSPPASRNCTAASTFGPMLPGGN